MVYSYTTSVLELVVEFDWSSQDAGRPEKWIHCHDTTGPEVIKCFSFSTQLSMKFILLINVKMPTIVGILTFISRINGWL